MKCSTWVFFYIRYSKSLRYWNMLQSTNLLFLKSAVRVCVYKIVGKMMDVFFEIVASLVFSNQEFQSGIIQNMKFNLIFSAEFPCSHDKKKREFQKRLCHYLPYFNLYTYPASNQTCFGGGDNFVFSGKNTHFFDKICIIL